MYPIIWNRYTLLFMTHINVFSIRIALFGNATVQLEAVIYIQQLSRESSTCIQDLTLRSILL